MIKRVQYLQMQFLSMSLFRFVIIPTLLLSCGVAGQTEAPSASGAEQARGIVLDPVQGGWNAQSIVQPANSGSVTGGFAVDLKSELDRFRAERNMALARNQGTLPPAELGKLGTMASELNGLAAGSFEAHLANYYVAFPSPGAFSELDKARSLGVGRSELLGPLLVAAARTDDRAELVLRAKEMKANGEMAAGLYRLAQDIFASLERDAVLIAAGEMDAFPLWVGQYADGQRTDVLVVDERLLADAAYRTRIWGRAKASGPVAPEQGFAAALGKASPRPVHLSLALGPAVLAPLSAELYVTGIAMRYSVVPVDNIPMLEARWGKFSKALDAGPLSRNYLVPGSVLLAHYRAIGDEARASALELELRRMAERLGATNSMIKSGVFAH